MLLDIWDRGTAQPPAARALALLAAADPATPPAALAALPVGERDSRLLTIRESIFGAHLEARAACPDCAMQLDLSFQVGDIRAAPDGERAATLTLAADGYRVEFRLPNSHDLLALAGLRDVEGARQALLARCILAVQPPAEVSPGMPLPGAIQAAVVARLAEADPQADVQLALSCPACDHRWQESFDIVSFLWTELEAWACRMMREVHTLARAYGWREAEILALGPKRRQFYLELVSG